MQEAYESRQPLLTLLAAYASRQTAIAFDKDGKHVLVGDDHGVVTVIESDWSSIELGASIHGRCTQTVRLYGVLQYMEYCCNMNSCRNSSSAVVP